MKAYYDALVGFSAKERPIHHTPAPAIANIRSFGSVREPSVKTFGVLGDIDETRLTGKEPTGILKFFLQRIFSFNV